MTIIFGVKKAWVTMPICSKCNKTQARFKNAGSLCTNCFNDANAGQVTCRNNLDNVDATPTEDGIAYERIDMTKKVGELAIGELMGLMQQIVKPLEEKMEVMNKNLTAKVALLEKRVNILEKEDNIKNERIMQLTDTVVNMQRALNSIDAKDRAKNVIVSGLLEEDMLVGQVFLSGDMAKMKFIFEKIGIDQGILNGVSMNRIGNDINAEKRRFLKITLKDYESREQIIKNAPKLKDVDEALRKIYINRDTHPVYQREYQRLRKKFNDLKNGDEYEPGAVKLVKGVLTINDEIVDRNIFLK